MFDGLSLCGRAGFGVFWCPWAVSQLNGGHRLCSRSGLAKCAVTSDERGIYCPYWRPDGSPVPEQPTLF